MNRFILIILIAIISTNLFSQNEREWKSNLIKSLSIYRTKLLTINQTDLVKLKNTLEYWREWEPRTKILNNFIFQVQYASLIRNKSFESIKKKTIDSYPDLKLAKNFSEDQLKSIVTNSELTDLIILNIISNKFPFIIVPDLEVFKELEFYNIQENEMIAEIGAGKGVFSSLIAMTNNNLSIYVNEIDQRLLKYIEHKIKKKNINLSLENFHLVKGSKKKINIPVPVDKIIIRNSFHHFSKKEKMLDSIKNALKKNGRLFIYELLRNKDGKSECKYRLNEAEIKSILKENNFKLEKELKLGNNIFLEYKVNHE